jgi:hypothetical protein
MDPMQSPAGEPAPQQKSGMPGWLKCCLIVGCLVLLIGGIAAGVMVYTASKMFMMDPVKVNALAKDIVPCEPPPGYAGFMGMNVAGVKMAMIAPEGIMKNQQPGNKPPLMIMIMSMPQKQDPAALKSQADMQLAKQGHSMSAEKSEKQTLKIRGHDVEVMKMVASDGQIAYELVLEQEPTATNPAGQEIIMIMGPGDRFDQKAMDAFVGSIK